MSRELDLIPASYRERLKIKRWCQLFLATFVILVMLIVIIKFSIVGQTKSIKTRISSLQKDKSFNLQQQQKYNELLALETRLQKNLELLNGLRGGPAVRQILQVIDRVMDEGVWFTQWSFNRAGEVTEVKPQTVQSGYFIIIPQNTAGNNKPQAWKLNTHMEIRGQAKDHASLSKFVGELIGQAEIEDVKVISTGLQSYEEYQVVNFNLVVIVNNRYGTDHV